MRMTEKVTRNIGILRRELAGKGSRSLVESVVEEALPHQESTNKIWKVKAKEFYWGREHWEKVMLEPIGGKLLEYRRGEYVIFEAPAHLVEDYIRRRILLDYEILEEHGCPYTLHQEGPTTRDYWASLIVDEEKAEVEYKRLSDMMAPGGPIETATWVREIVWGIAEDEKRHAQQLKDILESLAREGKIV